LALAIPDICGWLENPTQTSKERFVAWFNVFMLDKYTSYIGPNREKHIFLNGVDCYALRCAFLHEGADDITRQRSRRALNDFQFVVTREGWTIHCNQSNQTLQLQVDVFCEDICQAAEIWIKDIAIKNPEIISRMSELLVIEFIGI